MSNADQEDQDGLEVYMVSLFFLLPSTCAGKGTDIVVKSSNGYLRCVAKVGRLTTWCVSLSPDRFVC